MDFFDGLDREWHNIADKLVYTGRIDEFYKYQYGRLQYRSLLFEHETVECHNYQGVAIMNYTDRETPYTRIIEHKHFETFNDAVYDNPYTVITREYPMELTDGKEPYYPINDEKNNQLYQQYKALADKETNIIFGGRLAEYRYYDMDDVIESNELVEGVKWLRAALPLLRAAGLLLKSSRHTRCWFQASRR